MPVPNKNVTGRTKSGTGAMMMTIRIPVTGLGWAGADWGMGGRCASVLANRCSPRRGVGGSPATSSFPADCEGVRCPPNYSSFFFLSCFFAFPCPRFSFFRPPAFFFLPALFFFPVLVLNFHACYLRRLTGFWFRLLASLASFRAGAGKKKKKHRPTGQQPLCCWALCAGAGV